MVSVLGAANDAEGCATALAERHDELMDSILVEEENLVAFHRAKLEEDMETMRQEMALLQEVDKPGSEIDHYVEQMTALLNIKRQGIHELQVIQVHAEEHHFGGVRRIVGHFC